MLQNSLMKLLQINYPIIQAPMAGGITTTELVVAVSEEGGLGSIGAGYMSADTLREQIKEIKASTNNSFGVNIFVPSPFETSDEAVTLMDQALQAIRDKLQMDSNLAIEVPTYEGMVATYHKQIEVVLEESVPIVSFTFGLPTPEIVEKLKAKDITVMATATTVEEAIKIEALGIDVIIAQGSEAGGHRGNFLKGTQDSLIGLISLIPQIADRVKIPIIAAGGIMDGRGIAAALTLGASAAQMGTAFLTTEESGAHELYKQAILRASPTETTLTKAFSGKYARGISNEFMDYFEKNPTEILAYPVQNTLTQAIRSAAQEKENAEYMSLWSGQSPHLARDESVSELMNRIVNEIDSLIK